MPPAGRRPGRRRGCRGPRQGQLAQGAEEGVADLVQQRPQALAGRQRRGVVAHLDGGHRRRPQQLGAGLGVEGAGGGQQLPGPGVDLAQVVPQFPEQPQDPEQVRQRFTVVGQVPAHGGGQVARLGLQPPGPLALPGAPQQRVGLLGQRPVVGGVAARDLGGVGPGR